MTYTIYSQKYDIKYFLFFPSSKRNTCSIYILWDNFCEPDFMEDDFEF